LAATAEGRSRQRKSPGALGSRGFEAVDARRRIKPEGAPLTWDRTCSEWDR